jgi:hypothetical protein
MTSLELKDVIGPAGLFLATIVTQLAAILLLSRSQQLAYRRFTSEKLWDLKRVAYSKILSKCAKSRDAYFSLLPLYAFPDLSDDDRKRIHEERGSKALSARDELYAVMADDYIVCSKQFLSEFNRTNNLFNFHGTREEYRKETNYEWAQRQYRAANDMHESLMKQARNELHLAD